MSIHAEALRQIAIDISGRCNAGDFGGRHSLLRARMVAHALDIWRNAEVLEARLEVPARNPTNVLQLLTRAMWRRRVAG
jgi:hypothetical protein